MDEEAQTQALYRLVDRNTFRGLRWAQHSSIQFYEDLVLRGHWCKLETRSLACLFLYFFLCVFVLGGNDRSVEFAEVKWSVEVREWKEKKIDVVIEKVQYFVWNKLLKRVSLVLSQLWCWNTHYVRFPHPSPQLHPYLSSIYLQS